MNYATAKQYYRLDPETGYLYLRQSGKRADHKDRSGYMRVRFSERGSRIQCAAHRLVWLLHTGVWPDGDLDHKNQNRIDNRPANLRECTPSQNAANMPKYTRNTSGFRGVRRSHKRWCASIQANGKPERWLGTFDTPEAAYAAYRVAYCAEYGAWLEQ